MDELHNKKCVACDGNTIPFDTSEIHKYLKKVDGWDVKTNHNKNYYLEKNFKFKDFVESQKFVDKVCSKAEIERHHPDINFGWGYAKITIFTHSIKGLVESDFILASKIDQI
jgi:4a-hydroxytetrahydrobiopterin dehydratase|tara:strand:- start:181 stop:516 length:336 start_codon:yes stop_codon:yes gene_type:complete